jgi:hypothetical protein
MLRFNFESFFKDKAELRAEIADLLWQIDYIWPSNVSVQQLAWVKEKSDRAYIKLNGGARRQSIENVKDIHQHVSKCSCCPAPKT